MKLRTILLAFTLAAACCGSLFAQRPGELVSKENLDLRSLGPELLGGIPELRGATVSPDGKQVAIVTDLSGACEVWLAPAAGGWPSQLTFAGLAIANPTWSPDGRWIAVEVSTADGTTDLHMVSPTSGSVSQFTNSPGVSERELRWSPEGRQVAYRVGGETVVQNVLTRTKSAVANATWVGNAPAATPLAFRESAVAPRELWMAAAGVERQLTHTAPASLRASDLVEPVTVAIPQVERPALVFVPYNQRDKGKTPAVVSVRDEAAQAGNFDALAQYLANQGYLVAVVSHADAERVADWAKTVPIVDSLKLVLMGDAAKVEQQLREEGSPWAAGVVIGGKAAVTGRGPVLALDGALDGPRASRVAAFKKLGEFLKKHVPAPGCGCTLE